MMNQKWRMLLIVFFLPPFVLAQTKMIAFRSHSGNMRYFTSAEPDNLGAIQIHFPIDYPDTIVRLTDTSVLQVFNISDQPRHIDTVYNHAVFRNPDLITDKDNKDVYLGFKTKKDTRFADMTLQGEQRTALNYPLSGGIAETADEVIANQEDKSSVLYIVWLIGGLIFLGLLIWLSNRKKLNKE